MLQKDFVVREGGSFLFDRAGEHRIFTPEDLTDEQRHIRNAARQFADRSVLPRIDAIEGKEPGLMRALLEEAGELGLLMLDIPEKYGGLEQDKTTTMLVTETLTRCASFAVSLGAHVGIGSLPLVYFGTVAQKERYLPRLATGEWIAAYALTEPGSGSDALAAKTRAELADDGTHYVLNGSKQWITNAGFADLFVVFAQVAGEHFTAFLVERDTPGFEVGPEEHKHGIKGSSTCPLVLTDVAVPAANVLGEVGKGHRIAFNILNVGRARLGTGSIGAAKYALRLAAGYAAERAQFGRTLDQFGLIRAKLGDMAVRIFAGDALGYRTAGLIDKKYAALEALSPGPDDDDFQNAVEEFTIEASILKVYGSEALDTASDEALQIHGGYGYMAEYAIERVCRDARINRIFEGTNEINRLLLAGTLLKRGMKQRVPLMKAMQAVGKALAGGAAPALDPAGDRLVPEQEQVHRMKCAALYATQQAVSRWMLQIEDQQEVLGALADVLIDVYGADSALARTLQLPADGPAAAFAADATTLFIEGARDRVFTRVKQVLCAALSGDKRDRAFAELALLDHWRPIDVFAVRERVAAAVVAAGGWPL
ncbi:MAG: acyl-CoA dehydrogenase family protein [Deltaproteobacteria bacterium]|nr:acyl-CoA dehydrogenase family protein [Deltaproteobacteria bacterium]